MSLPERAGLAVLRRLDPERAHDLALRLVRSGLMPLSGPVTSSRLRTRIGALEVPNPVGLAAGFDKNATAVSALSRAGFGFIETGAATPRAQPGNPRPRVFRLPEHRAVINRFGFNNDGIGAIAPRLRDAARAVPVGLNLGANKDSADRAGDYAIVLEAAADAVDFVTVNVSSPNTERLRELQGAAALTALLRQVIEVRDRLRPDLPVWLKIAPDLSDAEIADVARVASDTAIDVIVATNTTLDRAGLTGPATGEAGGLSGRPLFERSTRVLARLASETGGAIPLVGVGGVASAEDARRKIRAGASAVQLYTGLVYGGLSLAARIARDLDTALARDGVGQIADEVGRDTSEWL